MCKSNMVYSDWQEDVFDKEYIADIKREYKEDTGEDMSDSALRARLDDEHRDIFDMFACDMKEFMKKIDGPFILTGRIQLWDGIRNGAKIIRDWDDMEKALSGYMNVIEDIGGKLIISQSHHDGTHIVELRPLTKKGKECYDRNYCSYLSNTDLTIQLANTRCYSKNANYAKVMW